jgi:hypothetical protein
MDRPLYWDALIEARERTRFVHALNGWIKKFLPNVAILARRPGRRSVETQLRQRTHFPEEAWRKHLPLPQVMPVLKLIQWELGLPNHNFLPDDSVSLLMDSCYGIDDTFVFQELETRYAVRYLEEELRRIREESWTLADLLHDLLDRRAEKAEKDKEKKKLKKRTGIILDVSFLAGSPKSPKGQA